MKKRNMIAALLCSACLVAGSVNPVFADASKVVTLGADLTDAQKQTMMKYFNVSSDQVQVMTITNEDEHKHLDNIAPQSQIGSRTLSCAYVKPTQSGGIKVRTANLNWVTGNMIATTLSTSGVKNCEVVAACPMEVSGTGALTGIQMAYETASGQKLDETKKKLATEEMVVTGNLADSVGQNDATTVINQAKMQVIADNVQNADDIYNIVVNISNNNNVTLTDDEINTIVNLLQQISQQDYDPQGASVTLLIAEGSMMPVQGETQVAHLDKSHVTVHTYPEYHPETCLATFRVDIDVATCGEITPLSTLDYLIGSFDSDIITMDYRVRGFTRDVDGKKLFMDREIRSIQDYISKETLRRYDVVDINVYEANLFHTKMMLKEIDLQNYLFKTDVYELPPTTRLSIMDSLRREMIEIFSGRNVF